MSAHSVRVEPGRSLRALAVVPGVRRVRDQIGQLELEWHDHNLREMAASGPDDRFLVALGDSLSQGVGATSLENTWLAKLVERLNRGGQARVRLLNFSRTGAKVADVVQRQLPRVDELDRPPLAVTCTVGSNDLLWSVRVEPALQQLRILIDRLPPSAVLATLPDQGSLSARAFNRKLRQAAEAASVPVADVARIAKLTRRSFASDGFHPNDRGYESWLEAFSAALVR